MAIKKALILSLEDEGVVICHRGTTTIYPIQGPLPALAHILINELSDKPPRFNGRAPKSSYLILQVDTINRSQRSIAFGHDQPAEAKMLRSLVCSRVLSNRSGSGTRSLRAALCIPGQSVQPVPLNAIIFCVFLASLA
jgi:hypothetical protein